MRLPFVAWLVIFLASSKLSADSYAPFGNFRKVEPTGRFYVVVKKLPGNPEDPGRGTRVGFEYAERKPGSPVVTDVEDIVDPDNHRRVIPNPNVRVRDGDRIHGRGELRRCPGTILISSTGLGFVGLDVGGYNFGNRNSDDAFVAVRADGTVGVRKRLSDLFSEPQIDRFYRTAGGVHWCGGGWIDEGRRLAIVVSSNYGNRDEVLPRLFRTVHWENGAVQETSVELVLTALTERNRGALDLALDLTAELKYTEAKAQLERLFVEVERPLATRLRCAVALAAIGDRRGAELMKCSCLERSPVQEYAVSHLPDLIGDAAAPVLCEIVRREGMFCHSNVWDMMRKVRAEAAVPALIQMMERPTCPICVEFAAECIGSFGPKAKAAVPALRRVLKSTTATENPMWTLQLAFMALGEIGPDAKAALPDLDSMVQVSRDRVKKLREQEELHGKKRAAFNSENDTWSMTYFDEKLHEAIKKIRGEPTPRGFFDE